MRNPMFVDCRHALRSVLTTILALFSLISFCFSAVWFSAPQFFIANHAEPTSSSTHSEVLLWFGNCVFWAAAAWFAHLCGDEKRRLRHLGKATKASLAMLALAVILLLAYHLVSTAPHW